jgi:hypothetical protein
MQATASTSPVARDAFRQHATHLGQHQQNSRSMISSPNLAATRGASPAARQGGVIDTAALGVAVETGARLLTHAAGGHQFVEDARRYGPVGEGGVDDAAGVSDVSRPTMS